MPKKILYILNVAKRVNNFSYTSMIAAQQLGMEFHIAGNWAYKNDTERNEDEKKYQIQIHQIDFVRTPYHPGNIKAYKQLKEIVKKEHFDIIHCNTPIGGVTGRLLGREFKDITVIYQAHGFHFYKGAPILNWMLYYPVERWLAHYTDILITINHEDYKLADSFKLRNKGTVCHVPGVGIDIAEFSQESFNRKEKRKELNIPQDAIVLLSVGEVNENKNHEIIIRTLGRIQNDKIYYVICGQGPLITKHNMLAKSLELQGRVILVGYQTNINEFYRMSDIFVFPSRREGLSVALMEAMAYELPIICSDIRGNNDLIQHEVNGLLVDNSVTQWKEAIERLAADEGERNALAKKAKASLQKYAVENVSSLMENIYSEAITL